MRETDTHIFFWNGEFSNWYPCRFRYKNLNFYNTEQAFMWEKAIFFHDTKAAENIIKFGHDPQVAKQLGRDVKGYKEDQWSKIRYQFMVDVNYEKYSQDHHLGLKLKETHPKTIVEASPTDSIWGIGLRYTDDRVLAENNWKGQNLLGKALMEVRDKIGGPNWIR